MNHLKCPNVIFPKYSFAVRHPVYNEYTVVNDVRAFEVDYTEAFNSIFAEPSSNYEPVRTCIAVLSYVENFNDKIVSELYDNGLDDQHPHLLEFVSQGGTDYALRMFGCWLYDTENHDPLSYHGDCTLPWLDTLIKKWVHTVAKSVLWVIPDKL